MSGTSLPHQHTLDECLPGSPGGRALKRRRGRAHFSQIGRRGGSTTAERYGRDHFVRAGKRSAEVRRTKKFKGPYVRRNRFSILTIVERIVPWWPHQPARQRNRKYPLLIVTDAHTEEVAP